MSRDAWLDRSRAAWDARAARWDAAAERHRRDPSRAADQERTIAALAIAPGDTLLDAGCGSGQWTIDLALRGFSVTALDLSPGVLDLARARASAEDAPPVRWLAADLAATGLAAGTLDAVLCRAALHFVPEPAAALQEFARILRPGGRLLASVPGALSPIYRSSWERHLPGPAGEVNWITPWELEFLLAATGWAVVDGWGDYGGDIHGDPNPFIGDALAGLDLRLRQAAATTWCVIACRDPGGTG
ncbi:MAG: class I SAM-dependent methyltransferase [Chloroflexota bacterium]